MSKAQRRYKVGYVSIRHESRRDITATRYSRSPSLHLKGDWLREAGFETGCPVTVKIEAGCLILTTEQATDD
ncbi:TPA: type I toxin-antitoxin system SymE family toxin [Serratia rubidaea]|nr:type I toxin-antitoxin system SymE family toxin [Serratia rubidaea]HDJ1446647.1 type I toxin-antitoxin system SymE family toxin [Serratia rubidaea]HDJ1460994.1 type I toxin-antitoxin system SymE family toxin [Serratia rubidaea]HDJ2773981.1 type I toxin-antitoxin system SymE family toxin [Serratia rubidaea]